MPWPWVILGRIPRLVPGDVQAEGVAAEVEADAQAEGEAEAGLEVEEEEEEAEGDDEAELEADGEHAADFSIPIALPPRVTVMTAAPTAQPDPNNPDKYPYILGVDSAYLLFNFGVEPFYGVCFDDRPYQSNLIVARPSDWAGVEQGHPTTATAERISPRDGEHSVTSNIESIGFLAVDDGPEDYIIAELMVLKGCERARLVYIYQGWDQWRQEDTPNPLPDHDREWVPSGVVSHGQMLWWFDLSWGLISFDPYDGFDVPLLLFHDLPVGRALDMALPGIHDHRCVTESEGELLYVEIIPGGEVEAAMVYMWTRISDPGGNNETIGWHLEHEVSFADIWDDDSYRETGLPRKVPVLAVVSPSNSDLVYFVLEQEERLFSVDMLTRTVFEFVDEDYDLVTPWPAPPSCRYVLPWYLPQEVAQALGMDPFDHFDGAGQLAAEIDAALEALTVHEEELVVEINAALEDDEDLQEAVFQYEEQLAAAINAELEALTDDEELQEAEMKDDDLPIAELSNEEMLKLDNDVAVEMDPATLSRLKAEVKEFAKDHQGPSQDPGDDAGEGAF